MRHIGDRIVPPKEFTETSIGGAIDDNIDGLLRKRMSRFAYARAVASTAAAQDLPPLHLMDHRVRLPRLQREDSHDEGALQAVEKRIEGRLRRMLVMSSHPGGRELVANALRLCPEEDASRFARAYEVSARFVNLVLRGRLGSALALIPALERAGLREAEAFAIVRQALVYHGALQAQLIAARGHCIDRLLLRLYPSPNAYTEAECCKQLWELLCAVEHIIKKLSRETNQPPQRAIVTDRRSRAEEHRAGMSLPDEEIVTQVAVFFSKRRDELTHLRESLRRLKDTATVESLHRAVFGVTSVEALLFASTRLVQLRKLSPDLLSRNPDNLCKFIPVSNAALPTIGDPEVAKLVYTYRALILRDDAAPDIVDNNGHNVDLAAAWRADASGNLHASNTTKKRSKYLRSQACKRERLTGPSAGRLVDGQLIDVLPDYLMQRFARVQPVLPGARLLAQVKTKREQEQVQRPPNIRKAPKRAARP